MRKQALVNELSGGIDSVLQHPAGQIGSVVGGVIPGVGTAISGTQAVNEAYKGNLGTAALHAGLAGIGLLPGGGTLGHFLGKGLARAGGAVGMGAKATQGLTTAGRAVGSVLKPDVASKSILPMAGHVGLQMGGGLLAADYDTNRAMARPSNQLAMLERRRDMNDFRDWQKHKNTLQSMASPQGFDEPKQAEAPPIAYHSYSDILQNSLGVSKTVAPYLLAANLAMHTQPHVKNEDVGGTAKGLLEGGAATAGALGGIPAGALGGAALGKLVAHMGNFNPSRSMLNGAVLGSVAGGYAGHRMGQAVPGVVAENLLTPKYGAYKRALDIPGSIKSFGRGMRAMGIGAQSISKEPHLMTHPGLANILSPMGRAAYGTGSFLEKLPGVVSGGLDKGRQPIRQAGEWLSSKGNQMSEPSQARNTVENSLQRQARDVETFNTKLKNSPAGEEWHINNGNIGGAEYTGKDIKDLGNKAYSERLGGLGIGGKMKHYGGIGAQAVGNFAQKHPLTSAGITGLGIAGAGALGGHALTHEKEDEKAEPDKLKLAAYKAALETFNMAPAADVLPRAPMVPPISGPAPKPQPGALSQLLNSPKGKLGIAGTVGALGLGAYMLGRGKRNDEDNKALKDIDRQGYVYNS